MTFTLTYDTTCSASRSTSRRTFGPAQYLAVWRQRRVLARLDDNVLKDIGISRAEAEAEAARPFWDLPR